MAAVNAALLITVRDRTLAEASVAAHERFHLCRGGLHEAASPAKYCRNHLKARSFIDIMLSTAHMDGDNLGTCEIDSSPKSSEQGDAALFRTALKSSSLTSAPSRA